MGCSSHSLTLKHLRESSQSYCLNLFRFAAMIYHIIVGDEAAKPLTEALSADPVNEETVLVLKDLLHIGPLQKEEGQKFSELRSAFWQTIVPQSKEQVTVEDMERILQVSHELHQSETPCVWFWMAPAAADVTAYYWLLFYFKKYRDRFFVVNVGGLPFLDTAGKLFYPKNISEIPPKELLKARRLARVVTPSEMEVDTDEWEKIKAENAAIRAYEGGKKLSHKSAALYDQQLSSFCSQQFQKASKIIRQAMSKYALPTGDLYLGWRLRQLVAEGALQAQGDTSKPLNEWEVKLAGGNEETSPNNETQNNTP